MLENDTSARRLAKEVDALMCEAFDAGLGSRLLVKLPEQREKLFRVDRILINEERDACEIWLSAEGEPGWWDRLMRRRRRELLRVSRQRSEIRQSITTVSIGRNNAVKTVDFKEYVAVPRKSPQVTRYSAPRRDSLDWVRNHANRLAG